jgi:hypothetical protein
VDEVAAAVVVVPGIVDVVAPGRVVDTAVGEEHATASRAIRVRRFVIHRR